MCFFLHSLIYCLNNRHNTPPLASITCFFVQKRNKTNEAEFITQVTNVEPLVSLTRQSSVINILQPKLYKHFKIVKKNSIISFIVIFFCVTKLSEYFSKKRGERWQAYSEKGCLQPCNKCFSPKVLNTLNLTHSVLHTY